MFEELTGADFDDANPVNLKERRCAFVLYYADWCGHCQNFKPEYNKFADTAQFLTEGGVNYDQHQEFVDRLKLGGFPTVRMYHCGKYVGDYDGPRTSKDLLAKATKMCNEKCKY